MARVLLSATTCTGSRGRSRTEMGFLMSLSSLLLSYNTIKVPAPYSLSDVSYLESLVFVSSDHTMFSQYFIRLSIFCSANFKKLLHSFPSAVVSITLTLSMLVPITLLLIIDETLLHLTSLTVCHCLRHFRNPDQCCSW